MNPKGRVVQIHVHVRTLHLAASARRGVARRDDRNGVPSEPAIQSQFKTSTVSGEDESSPALVDPVSQSKLVLGGAVLGVLVFAILGAVVDPIFYLAAVMSVGGVFFEVGLQQAAGSGMFDDSDTSGPRARK